MTKYVFVGLAIREILSFWTGHTYDFEIWVRLGFYMQHLGNPYTTLPYVQGLSFAPYPLTGSISYPPFSAFIFAGVYRLYLSTGVQSRFLYYFLLKQPMVLSDVFTAPLLASIALSSFGDQVARRVLKIWAFFPYSLIVSSLWGALDPVALLLILASASYFQKGKMTSSGLMLGFAIYLKTLPVIGLPVLLMRPGLSLGDKVRLSSYSLLIPVLGILVPFAALGWSFEGLRNNFSYQIVIPAYGALSAFGPLGLLSVPGWILSVTGIIWLPALFVAYFYLGRRRVNLTEGLMTVFLVFSVSRPLLPLEWAIYPLAFLLAARKTVGNFVGLALSAMVAMLADNALLVRFFSPISLAAFYWDNYVDNFSPLVYVRVIIISISAGFFLLETILTLTGRPSLIFQSLSSMLFRARQVSRLEIWRFSRA